MSLFDTFLDFIERIFGKITGPFVFLKDKISGIYARYIFPSVKKIYLYIDRFQVKFLGKGKLGNRVFVRYVVKELFLYFCVAFLFFFMIFFCNQILLLAESILKKRVPFWNVCQLMAYTLPFVIAQSAPFATLVGFLMCLGRIMSDNEILILRASGQGYAVVMIPVLVMGLLISVLSFFVNDYLLPVGTINYNRLYRQILSANPGVEIEANTIKRFNDSTIVIGDIKDGVVQDLIFFDKGADGKQRIIVSGLSRLSSSRKEGVLMQMNMSDSVVVLFDRKNRRTYDVLDSGLATLNIFDSMFFSQNYVTSPREMTSYDLGRTIKSIKKHDSLNKRQLNLYLMEFNKKFSLPFGSIFFAILAIPLAFLFGKHNGQTIGLVVGLIICVLYWAMMILGQIFSSRNGMNGVVAMWLPDLVIGVSGLFFYVLLKKR